MATEELLEVLRRAGVLTALAVVQYRPLGDRLLRHSMRAGTDSSTGSSRHPPTLGRFADRADASRTNGGISRTTSIRQSRGGPRVLRRSVSENVARWADSGWYLSERICCLCGRCEHSAAGQLCRDACCQARLCNSKVSTYVLSSKGHRKLSVVAFLPAGSTVTRRRGSCSGCRRCIGGRRRGHQPTWRRACQLAA